MGGGTRNKVGMMGAAGTRVWKVGEIPFDELDSETRDDVLMSLADVLRPGEGRGIPDILTPFREGVLIALENGPAILPLVEVSPEAIFDPNRVVSKNVVESYAATFREGDDFPPVVIDSSRGPAAALLEGGHRTAAAVLAGVPRILAIDLAGARLVRMTGRWEGLETYDFKHARRKGAERSLREGRGVEKSGPR